MYRSSTGGQGRPRSQGGAGIPDFSAGNRFQQPHPMQSMHGMPPHESFGPGNFAGGMHPSRSETANMMGFGPDHDFGGHAPRPDYFDTMTQRHNVRGHHHHGPSPHPHPHPQMHEQEHMHEQLHPQQHHQMHPRMGAPMGPHGHGAPSHHFHHPGGRAHTHAHRHPAHHAPAMHPGPPPFSRPLNTPAYPELGRRPQHAPHARGAVCTLPAMIAGAYVPPFVGSFIPPIAPHSAPHSSFAAGFLLPGSGAGSSTNTSDTTGARGGRQAESAAAGGRGKSGARAPRAERKLTQEIDVARDAVARAMLKVERANDRLAAAHARYSEFKTGYAHV
jgi:hypothetical protein